MGTVCAATLSRFGFDVLGVDVNETKNAQINDGRSPIVEPGLEELIREAVEAGRLALTAYATSKLLAEQDLAELADETFAVTSLRFATACGMSDRLRLDLVLNDFVAGTPSGRSRC